MALVAQELSKARDRLEKATAVTTGRLFDNAVDAMVAGLDSIGGSRFEEGEETETLTVSTYFFGKQNEFWDDMQANGVTPRRLFLYSLLGAGVALGGNLFGVTSGVLGTLAPGAARDARLDVLFPIDGFKRCYDEQDGYEFMYPQEWVGDTGLALQKEQDREGALGMSATTGRARQRRGLALRPDAAFGPQGGDGKENVSVVKSQLLGGFSLSGTMGTPKEAAERLLSKFIAPPGSGKEWELLDAYGEERGQGGLVYQFEYRVQGPGFQVHNFGVVAARGETLFTLTVLAPEELWGDSRKAEKLRRIARSFKLSY
ncbi:unnamed protein product [Discosporangium mesarthrocarpum]